MLEIRSARRDPMRDPFLEDLWKNREDIGSDFQARQMSLSNKLTFPEREEMQRGGLFPPLRQKNVSPFKWKGRGQKDLGIVRWIWHPVTGQFLMGDQMQHAVQVPGGSKFGEWVRGFWDPKNNRVMIRTYFNPTRKNDSWNGEHARTNARVMERIEKILRAHLTPLVGNKLEIITNVDNDDVQQYTGWRQV